MELKIEYMDLALFSLASFSPLSHSNLGWTTFVDLPSLPKTLGGDQLNSMTFQFNENNFHKLRMMVSQWP